MSGIEGQARKWAGEAIVRVRNGESRHAEEWNRPKSVSGKIK